MDELFCRQRLVEIAHLSREIKMFDALAKDELLLIDRNSAIAEKNREERFAAILSSLEDAVQTTQLYGAKLP